MNKLEYLNTIAKDNRPVSRKTSGLPGGLIAKIAVAGVVLFIILMVVGSLLGNSSSKATSLTQQLSYRTTNLNNLVAAYNKFIKSSKLRAINLSLSTAFVGSANQLATYMAENDIDPEPSQKILDSENELFTNLDITLNNARLNGILDRIYTNQIHLQVSLLLSLISQDLSRTNDAELISILESYSSNLTTIKDTIEAYSNTSS